MLKYLFIFLFPLSVKSQDSLKKYSYLIYQIGKDSTIHTGTGAFVKVGHKVYFLSSKHVFGGFDSDAKKKLNYPDTLYILLKDKKTGTRTKYLVDIKKYKRLTIPTYNFESPDYVSFLIKNPEHYEINSIEKFISNEVVVDSAISYIVGFGYLQKKVNKPEDIFQFEPLQFSGTTNGEYSFKMYHKKYDKVDSINYYAYPTNYLDLRGASGSSIFQVLKSGKILFGGIYTASNPEEKIYLFVRPNFILNSIKRKSMLVNF